MKCAFRVTLWTVLPDSFPVSRNHCVFEVRSFSSFIDIFHYWAPKNDPHSKGDMVAWMNTGDFSRSAQFTRFKFHCLFHRIIPWVHPVSERKYFPVSPGRRHADWLPKRIYEGLFLGWPTAKCISLAMQGWRGALMRSQGIDDRRAAAGSGCCRTTRRRWRPIAANPVVKNDVIHKSTKKETESCGLAGPPSFLARIPPTCPPNAAARFRLESIHCSECRFTGPSFGSGVTRSDSSTTAWHLDLQPRNLW